jgi:hypothetical protein
VRLPIGLRQRCRCVAHLAWRRPAPGLDTCSVPEQLVVAGNVRKPEVDRAIEFVVEVANVLSRPT